MGELALCRAHLLPGRPGPGLLALQGRGAGAAVRKGKPSGVWVTHQKMRHAEKQLAAQAQASYERMVRDWKAASPKKDVGASVTAERA